MSSFLNSVCFLSELREVLQRAPLQDEAKPSSPWDSASVGVSPPPCPSHPSSLSGFHWEPFLNKSLAHNSSLRACSWEPDVALGKNGALPSLPYDSFMSQLRQLTGCPDF